MTIKKKLNKKAESMTFNIIVGAVIALAVMIIIMMIFADKAGTVSDFYSKCEKTGVNPVVQSCNANAPCECPDGKIEYLPLRQTVVENKIPRVKALCCVERFA